MWSVANKKNQYYYCKDSKNLQKNGAKTFFQGFLQIGTYIWCKWNLNTWPKKTFYCDQITSENSTKSIN